MTGNNSTGGSGVAHEWIFIDESEIATSPAQTLRSPVPNPNLPVDVPFPPNINPADLIRRNRNGDLLSRATNKFLIYRNEYAKELQNQGFRLSMREVSRMAAKAWKREPQHVKRKYEDIAREVERIHVQLSMSSSSGWERRRPCYNRTSSEQEFFPIHNQMEDNCVMMTVPQSIPQYSPYIPFASTIPYTPTVRTVPSHRYSPIPSPVDSRQLYLVNNCGTSPFDYFQYDLYNEPLSLPIETTPSLSPNFEIPFGFSSDADSLNDSLGSSPEAFDFS
ncbi:6428_t:CDS:1 [Funneliformis caledonium]|uniref:6428_t:CDS:1 n=1 Tax=Funneliformis caledonium TaxID=1117310 RepID=A0A9N8WFA6_9GLOM|nr:6428_t:CDS:1 [Funneliformis caledonium]